ncbi:sensor histidine kinase [Parafrigoribacterium soli]|uniref:sensor histidine kinase n=1 Tax=Parafrigoribacterium soli TaxID=3144663 RepID=UPI0032EB2979
MSTPAAPAETTAHTPLTPVFIGLWVALHSVFIGLGVFVVVHAMVAPSSHASWIIALGLVLLVAYAIGAFIIRSTRSTPVALVWLAVLAAGAILLMVLTPDATFLVFPLFFLYLHLLPFRWGIPAVFLTTALTVIGFASHNGWTAGGVLGPLIGATVAVVIGLGYRALYREAQQRQQLIEELVRTREALATRERESGMLEERARLAREIHDTVAQGLSSIQMLLHAAEREGTGPAALKHVTLARETAADNLAEARRFIRELTPPALEGRSLGGALARLATSSSGRDTVVSFHSSGEAFQLPMRLETALLRIAQEALANVAQHAAASRAEVTLSYLDDWVGLDIVDDGKGFAPPSGAAAGTSFGLIAMRQRVEQLGGTLTIESREGAGTAIGVGFPLAEASS